MSDNEVIWEFDVPLGCFSMDIEMSRHIEPIWGARPTEIFTGPMTSQSKIEMIDTEAEMGKGRYIAVTMMGSEWEKIAEEIRILHPDKMSHNEPFSSEVLRRAKTRRLTVTISSEVLE